MKDKHIKVLLIEDNPGDARLIREMLAEARGVNFDLEHADRLSTGLKQIGVGDIDVILSDLSLPDSHGLDTFIQVHAQTSGVPIIVLSSLNDEELAVKAVQQGAQDYLVKGHIDSNLLVRSIRYATERKRVEEKIKTSLKEKEVLLKEIHHRVKNNLQVVSSLLSLQSQNIKDERVLEMFRDSQNRVRSMAFVHERLYQSRDLARIDFVEYIQNLINYLFRSYAVNTNVIKLKINADDVFLNVDTAIPCGLILNELVSNSLKHAFPAMADRPDGREGKICIESHSDSNGRFTLIVSDNGVGFPKDLDFRNTQSLGLKLVNTLVEQLDGSIELNRSGGTAFKITFAIPKYQ